MKLKIARLVHRLLGKEVGGTPDPPGSMCQLEFGENDDGRPMYVTMTLNDGSELWVGFHDKWLFHVRAKYARQLAWFVFWDWWAKDTWFGLKRWIWYKALHIIVEHMKTGQES